MIISGTASYGQTGSESKDSLICNTKEEQSFFNESVFLKEKCQAENIYLKDRQNKLLQIISKKNEQLIQKDTIISIMGKESKIASQQTDVVKMQLKSQKKHSNRVEGGLIGVIVILLGGLGYSLAH